MNSKGHRSMRPFIGLAIFTIVAGLTVFISGQQRGQMANPQSSMHVPILTSGPQPSVELPGVVEDWTSHHVAYSDPGTEDDAIRDGRHEDWVRIVNDPRYIMQQLIRRSPAQGPAAEYVADMNELARAQESAEGADVAEVQLQDSFPLVKVRGPISSRKPTLHRDWSMDLSSGATVATVGAGQYPAKYSFGTSGASCSDYVVFNTGLAGVSSGQANIVAYSNLYGTTCSTPVPSVYWAYYSGGGKALTSPIISLDGTKVAFVENPASGSGAAILRILAWQPSQGTPAAAATPAHSYSNGAVGAGGNTTWNTTNCPAGNSCMISVAFQSPYGNPDTRSAPFYIYDGTDTLYVGDASGYLHKFTGVFNGTPGEMTTGWPVKISASGYVLTSPVYDPASGKIFVADSGGFLHSYPAAGGTLLTTSQLGATAGQGIVDAPLVDSASNVVYVWVGYDGNTTTSHNCDATGCAGVFRFSTTLGGTSGTGLCASSNGTSWTSGTNCGSESVFGVGATSNKLYDGTPDNTYYANNGTAGNLWTCDNISTTGAKLVSSSESSFSSALSIANNSINPLTNAAGTCSPVTEILNGSTDYIFLSLTAGGHEGATCAGACVYSFTLSGTTASYSAGLASAGGTSGMIIDNTSSSPGASQVYFSTLGSQTCGGNGSTGSGTGGCAVQTSQAVTANATGTVTMITDPYTWPSGSNCTSNCTTLATVTVGSTIYTFKATPNGAGVQVKFYESGTASQDEADTAQNLAAAIMNNSSLCSSDTGSPCFLNVTGANASATATHSSNVTTLTATTPGHAGNFTLTTNYSTGITVSGGNNGSP